ncbi:hypothetical protein CW696_05080 [ANME-2 cluster archaeon]|nr:MAG: hypothetical protein CW696_05080 [ANME-2 cluster archaeon]
MQGFIIQKVTKFGNSTKIDYTRNISVTPPIW